jgi:hypothetical protein
MTAERSPIEPGDILKGDLIRNEWDDGTALEFRAKRDGDAIGVLARGDGLLSFIAGSSRHFLLDRPERPLLDDEWRLGWIHCENPENALGFWRMPDSGVEGRDDLGRVRIPRRPTGFTPATAVPTEALDELRRRRRAGQFNCLSGQPVLDFLDAVDKAAQP